MLLQLITVQLFSSLSSDILDSFFPYRDDSAWWRKLPDDVLFKHSFHIFRISCKLTNNPILLSEDDLERTACIYLFIYTSQIVHW